MASLAQIARLCPLMMRRSGSLAAPIVRHYWNDDWKPGPYPKTEQEKIAAAKKYGLRREDYEPVKDDGLGAGDYPDLPLMSPESRDPFENYDMPEMRRNYGEPVNVNADMYFADRFDPTFEPRFSYHTMFFVFCCFFVLPFAIHMLTKDYPKFLPVMPKQFPSLDGSVTHFTFEPATKKSED